MFTLNCRGRLLIIDQPLVMGILNLTPDSFYPGSRQQSIDAALAKAEQMIAEGAAILDIGGQSTRPGSESLNPEEESARVLPAISAISTRFPETFLSVDTYHSETAKKAVEAGASMVIFNPIRLHSFWISYVLPKPGAEQNMPIRAWPRQTACTRRRIACTPIR